MMSRPMPFAPTLVAALASLLLSACVTNLPYEPMPFGKQALPRFIDASESLESGVRLYEAGRYDAATGELNRALDLGLRTAPEIVRARKYLAFIQCATGSGARCRGEFREALRIDPNFELDRAEAGHPMWGPAFVEVRKSFVARRR